MRLPRVKAEEGPAFYHCVSRVVEGRFIFQTTAGGSVEAEHFVGLMRRLEAFSGVRVLTYALMSNHFHLLCQVPQAEPLSELELLERIEAGYGRERRQVLERQLARWAEPAPGASQSSQQLLEPYRRRMYDLSSFFKSSRVSLPSGTTGAMSATGYCGRSASRVFCSKGARRWRRWGPISSLTR